MSVAGHREFLAAALGEIDAMVARLSPARVLERDGLEAQKKDILDELAVLDSRASVSVLLEFSGDPVVGSLGVDAKFGSTALGKYQALVSAISPDDNRLLIVGTLRNSFGFELQEMANPLFRGDLHDAVTQASELIHSATVSDETFLSAIGQQEKQVQDALTDFISALRSGGASCRIVVGDRPLVLDSKLVETAAERTASVKRESAQDWVDGEFRGVTLDSRWFDFVSAGTLFRGKASKRLSVDALEDWNRSRMRTACSANIQTTTTSRLGSVSKSHVLLDIKDRKPEGDE